MGASGDMILGALFDLGADPEAVSQDLQRAGLDGFRIHFSRDPVRSRIAWGRCEVELTAEQGHGHGHGDEHGHGHGHGDEGETGHRKGQGRTRRRPVVAAHRHQAPPHAHRRLTEILAFIEGAVFAPRVKARARAVFQRLADAEAAVHGIPPEQVHFHEVGATDALVDIVGSCLALEQLGAEQLYCAPFKVGTGFIHCAHGVLPNPAPATVRLLEGFAVVRLPIEAELTTPTGAAILTALSAGDWGGLVCRWLKSGGGLGQRELSEGPNLLRAYLVETAAASEFAELLETDIDDDSPEALALLPDLLRANGALDATLTAVSMKKGRAGVRLTVLVPAGESARLAQLILTHSSSIGVRGHGVRRFTLPRTAAEVETPWGVIAAKRIERPHAVEYTPEFDAAQALSRQAGVPVREILQAGRRWERRSS